ncbi:type 3 dihydrofolate reductase [Pleionea litopenaei]|uniref:Dihydrofolate reductase n=1 Tax=Pleionea litopenaei TaxID=3070815 RepID=A0AA51X660_9GAMM|nr:type 3 dihydrofolate reductase [Pleionea sp. HL-JVS1]WMS85750.1 type 3 dihydrofolate reductase [Pleionea sp. HL-JVS1]
MQQPIISLVCAMANDRVIGLKNQMPWHLPIDLQHFKSVTMGKPIVMGRKTFESIGRPLPGRRNIIITRNKDYAADGIEIVNSLESALELLSSEPEIMITGGGNVYSQALPLADRLYLTFIDLNTQGDAFFPEFSELDLNLIEESVHIADEKSPHDCRFVTYAVNKNTN